MSFPTIPASPNRKKKRIPLMTAAVAVILAVPIPDCLTN